MNGRPATGGDSFTGSESLVRLERRLTRCRLCPRLVEHRERVGCEKVARFRAWTYWARPVPGFGDPAARLRPGDELETAFRYPGDYAPPDATTPVRQTIAVRAIEPAGEGQVWAGTVRDTHALFLTAGVLCAE